MAICNRSCLISSISVVSLFLTTGLQAIVHYYPLWWTIVGTDRSTQIGIWYRRTCINNGTCYGHDMVFDTAAITSDSVELAIVRILMLVAAACTVISLVLLPVFFCCRSPVSREGAVVILCFFVISTGLAGFLIFMAFVMFLTDTDRWNFGYPDISLWLTLPTFAFAFISAGVSAGEELKDKPIYHPRRRRNPLNQIITNTEKED